MKKIRGLEKWLTNDPEMLSWVSIELLKINAMPTQPILQQASREHLQSRLINLAQSQQGINSVRKMRQDWSKKIYADKPENQTVTFTLTPQVIKKLDQFRGKFSRRQVLEWLIEQGDAVDTEMRKERREAIKAEKVRLEQKWPKKNVIHYQQVLDANEIQKLQSINSAQENLIQSLIFKNSQLKELAKAHNATCSDLTDEQKLHAQNDYKDSLEYHINEIRCINSNIN